MKLGEKESFDWPIAEVAVSLELTSRGFRNVSVILGAAAPVPWRARAAEEVLEGKGPWIKNGEDMSSHPATLAAAAAVQGATPLEKNAYKIPVIQAVVRRTILAAVPNVPVA